MASTGERLSWNRFSPLDSDLGTQHTAKGMTQDIYESKNKVQSPVVLSPAMNSLASSIEHSAVKYSLEFLLQVRASSKQQNIPAIPIGTAHDNVGTSLDTPEEFTTKGTFPYAWLPAELRQMVLRELLPSKSIWNGTSFPKSCQKQHHREYFEKTKYLQNRALAHWNMTTPPEEFTTGWPQDAMFSRDIDAFFSHEGTYWLIMGATEFFLFKCLALGPRYHHLLPRQANWLPTCYGDQISWGCMDEYQSPLRHHNTLRENRRLWKEIVESRWDRGPLKPGYLKFIGRFRNLRIVCFMGHITDADEALITILDGISHSCPTPGRNWDGPDICTSVGIGRESWFSTCAGCVHCLGSTDYVEITPSDRNKLSLAWEPGLRHWGPSAHNLAYKTTRMKTEEALFNPHIETWDDPVRAAMLRVSPDFNLDPDAVKELIQPMYGKEGLVDAWEMWNKWAHHGWDRVTFAKHHESVGFFWSRTFPDTTRFHFSSKVAYSDPLVPGKKHSLDIAGQFIGRHDATPFLRGRDAGEEESTQPGVEDLIENSH